MLLKLKRKLRVWGAGAGVARGKVRAGVLGSLAAGGRRRRSHAHQGANLPRTAPPPPRPAPPPTGQPGCFLGHHSCCWSVHLVGRSSKLGKRSLGILGHGGAVSRSGVSCDRDQAADQVCRGPPAARLPCPRTWRCPPFVAVPLCLGRTPGSGHVGQSISIHRPREWRGSRARRLSRSPHLLLPTDCTVSYPSGVGR